MHYNFPDIPVRDEEKGSAYSMSNALVSFVAAALTLFTELFVISLFLEGGISRGVLILVHGVIILVLSAFTYLNHRVEADLRFSMLLVISTAVMGPIGAGGTLMSIITYVIYSRTATPFAEWLEAMFPAEQKTKVASTYQHIVSHGHYRQPHEVIPFLDVLDLGTVPQKREALARITRYFRPLFAPALRKAANDNSNAVRVQAATAISRIEDAFQTYSQKLDEALNYEKDNTELIRLSARHYDEYAYTGILDPDREKDCREKALSLYSRYLEKEKNDVDARVSVGRLLLKNGEQEAAANWFAKCVDGGWVSGDLLLWYMETLYNLKRLSTLRHIADTYYEEIMSDRESYPQQVVDTIRLWTTKSSGAEEAYVKA